MELLARMSVVEEKENNEAEPQITSSDPEERKLARALRIKRRIEAIKKQHEQDGEELSVVEETFVVEKQIDASSLALEELLLEGEESVTNVRIGCNSKDVHRREHNASRRAELIKKLEEEARQTEEVYEELHKKWEKISKLKDPLNISDGIALQKEQCNELIKQKDDIIKMLKDEINLAELKYVTDQENQREDLSTMVRRIEKQIDLMRKSYRTELQAIEDIMATERQNIVEATDKKWEQLYKQRNEQEELNTTRKIKLADEFLETINQTRVHHEEKFRETKIAIEKEVETLQLELEQLKAACLLNGEKLDYNYNILKKREDENMIIRSQQKRLLNKLQDDINKMKRGIEDYRQKSQEQVDRLSFEIRKMRDSIFQIEKKAESICKLNDRKFKEVWKLNETAVRAELDKILQADDIIHEQLLAVELKQPHKPIFKMQSLGSYRDAMDILNAEAREAELRLSRAKYDENEKNTNHLLKEVFAKIAYRANFLLDQQLKYIFPALEFDECNLIKIENVFDVLGLNNEADFQIMINFFLPHTVCPICDLSPVEKKAKSATDATLGKSIGFDFKNKKDESDEKISEPLLEEKDSQPKVLDLAKSVIDAPSTIAEIVRAELEECHDETTADHHSHASSDLSENLEELEDSKENLSAPDTKIQPIVGLRASCKLSHPLKIEQANLYKILREFVAAFNFDANQYVTLQKRVQKQYHSLARLLSPEDIKYFWQQFYTIFTTSHEELWYEITYGLKKYHSILLDRTNIYKQVVVLRKENQELKHMLKHCGLKEKKKNNTRKKNIIYKQ